MKRGCGRADAPRLINDIQPILIADGNWSCRQHWYQQARHAHLQTQTIDSSVLDEWWADSTSPLTKLRLQPRPLHESYLVTVKGLRFWTILRWTPNAADIREPPKEGRVRRGSRKLSISTLKREKRRNEKEVKKETEKQRNREEWNKKKETRENEKNEIRKTKTETRNDNEIKEQNNEREKIRRDNNFDYMQMSKWSRIPTVPRYPISIALFHITSNSFYQF